MIIIIIAGVEQFQTVVEPAKPSLQSRMICWQRDWLLLKTWKRNEKRKRLLLWTTTFQSDELRIS